MKKVISTLCGILMPMLLYAPKADLGYKQREIILQHLQDCRLKKLMLDQKTEVLPLLNFFLIQVYLPSPQELSDVVRNMQKGIIKPADFKMFFLYLQYLRMRYDAAKKIETAYDEFKFFVKERPVLFITCDIMYDVMKNLGGTILDITEQLFPVLSAVSATLQNKHQIRQLLKALEEDQVEKDAAEDPE